MRRELHLFSAWVFGVALLASSGAATGQEYWPSQPEKAQSPSQPVAEPGRSPSRPGRVQQPAQPRSTDPYGGAVQPARPGPPAVVSPPQPVRSPAGPQPVKSPPAPQPPKVSPPYVGAPRRQPPPQPPVVTPGWPIKRPLNPVVVRPRYDDRHRHGDHDRWGRYYDDDRYPYYYNRPLVYLPLLMFGGFYVSGYDDPYYWRDRLLWEDAITIYGDEGWIEFTLDCGARGERLWVEVRDGRARIDWAEIVFEDGEVQVVEFSERSLGPGLYGLLEMRDPRRIDYVRMAARASTREVRLILRVER